MRHIYIIGFFCIFIANKNYGQLNLPLKFTDGEIKWSNLTWIEENPQDDQWFEMRVPPIIIEDTIYTFMNYKGLFQTGPYAGSSVGYCGYSIKKINKTTGNTYWETRRIYKDFNIRKALSQPKIVDNKLVITLHDEAPVQFPGTWWETCYPAHITLDLSSGNIVDSNYVDQTQQNLIQLNTIAGFESQFGNTSPRIYFDGTAYEHRRNKAGQGFFEITKTDLDGMFLSRDSVPFPAKFLIDKTRYFELSTGNIAVVQGSQNNNWGDREVLIGHFDKDMNLINTVDITSNYTDTVNTITPLSFNNDRLITVSGFRDFEAKTERLDWHMYDIDGNLIDKIRYTLRDGRDNGIVYGHFYPLADIINDRILLTRCRQDKITEATYFDIFARDGDSIKLIKRTWVEGIEDHFRTEYAAMLANGDILMHLRQFIWSNQGFAGDYPRFYPWVLLDGQKMNIVSSTKDVVNINNLILYPNPTFEMVTFQNLDHPANVIIYDLHGKIVISFDSVIDHVDISHLPSGIYIFEIRNSTINEKHKVIKIE